MNVIATDDAPKAIGPYSQAIVCTPGKMVFLSGQIPLDPKTMLMVPGDVKEQTKQVLQNLKAVLRQANCTFENVVKTTIFLKDMNDFAAVNEIYSEIFSGHRPARATVEVSRLPKDAKVEIEAIAVC